MLIGEQERHDIGHQWSPGVLRGGWHRGLAARLAGQARRWSRRLPGSPLPRSGMAATPVGRQVAFLDRSGLAVYTKPSSGWTGKCSAGRWSSTAVGGEGRFWIMDRRSLPLLSRWGTLHDVWADQRSAKP